MGASSTWRSAYSRARRLRTYAAQEVMGTRMQTAEAVESIRYASFLTVDYGEHLDGRLTAERHHTQERCLGRLVYCQPATHPWRPPAVHLLCCCHGNRHDQPCTQENAAGRPSLPIAQSAYHHALRSEEPYRNAYRGLEAT